MNNRDMKARNTMNGFLRCSNNCTSLKKHELNCENKEPIVHNYYRDMDNPYRKSNKTLPISKENLSRKSYHGEGAFDKATPLTKVNLPKSELKNFDYMFDAYCTACGAKNMNFFSEDQVIRRWRCDECDEWNEFDEVMKKNVMLVNKGKKRKIDINISFPTIFTKERKARIGAMIYPLKEKLGKLWFKKRIKPDGADYIIFFSIIAMLNFIPLFMTNGSHNGINDVSLVLPFNLTLILFFSIFGTYYRGFKSVLQQIGFIGKKVIIVGMGIGLFIATFIGIGKIV